MASNTESIESLRADIAEYTAHAKELMADIADAMIKGKFSYASVQTDYLQGQIKAAERTQKRLAKLEAQS